MKHLPRFSLDNRRRFIGHERRVDACIISSRIKYSPRSDGAIHEEKKTANCMTTLNINHFIAYYRRSTTRFHRFHVDLTSSLSLVCFRNTSAKDRRCGTACPPAWRKVSATILSPIVSPHATYTVVVKEKNKIMNVTIYFRETVSRVFRAVSANTKSTWPLVNPLASSGRPTAGQSVFRSPIDEIYSR